MTRNQRYLGAISRAIFDTDLTGVRLCLALSEFLWAIMLLWIGDTFGRPTYLGMSHVMREEGWALLFLVSGTIQISIVMQDDYHSRFARYFAGYNAVLWTFVVTSMLMSIYPPPAAISAEITMALVATWIWVRPYILAEGYRRARACI